MYEGKILFFMTGSYYLTILTPDRLHQTQRFINLINSFWIQGQHLLILDNWIHFLDA